MEMFVFIPFFDLKYFITLLATIAGLYVITTKNAIISVFNLIVLYVLVSFYLIYIGIAYIGISYIVIYIGAIAILFLFIIMMIDIEVVEKRNNNYLLLLFLLLGGFLYILKNIFYNLGLLKIKNFLYNNISKYFVEDDMLFNYIFHNYNYNNNSKNNQINLLTDSIFDTNMNNNNLLDFTDTKYNVVNSELINNNELNQSLISKGFSLFNNSQINLEFDQTNYLLIIPDWNSAVYNISQISAIGEVLYSTYNAYIYIVSVILLLALQGAIILTADHKKEIKFITLTKNNNNKSSNILSSIIIFIDVFKKYIYSNNIHKKYSINKIYGTSIFGIVPFYDVVNVNTLHSEEILGTLPYYLISNIIIGLLFLFINYYFSLSIKYLDKGGGFECGFTSFLQTRERYNIAFYRVSLLFLVFDLEIILAFPYTAIYQKDENISKNTILAFLYILIVGFVYELKEGALNIVKTAHSTEIKITD
jgi:NADH-ubiquinone oxidoreductase chain 6